MRRHITCLMLVAGAIVASGTFANAAAQQPQLPAGLDSIRMALAKYANPIVAVHDGYFSSLGCVQFDQGGGMGQMQYVAGAMGVHFLNLELVGKPLDPLHPQVLLYEPVGDSLRLTGAEWFVPTAIQKQQPQLLGRGFDGPMAGHEPLLPESLHHWDLHVWLWKQNPAGLFSPTNPAVKCPATAYTMHEVAPKMVEP